MTEIPHHMRAAIAEQLERLVQGEFPDLLHWVGRYGANGTQLVTQPAELWDLPDADAVELELGGWHVTLPLFTVDESPSDLLADVMVDADGVASIYDVRVP